MTERKILLTSDGPRGMEEHIVDLLGKNPRGVNALYFPAILDKTPYILGTKVPKRGDRYKEVIINMGMHVTRFPLDREEKPAALEKAVKACRLLLFSGGNPYEMLAAMKRWKVDKILLNFMDSGGVVITTSATTVALGPEVGWIALTHPLSGRDRRHSGSLNGFGFYEDSLWPHYREDHQRTIDQLNALKLPYRVVPLKDGQAIKVVGSKRQIIEAKHYQTSSSETHTDIQLFRKQVSQMMADLNCMSKEDQERLGKSIDKDVTWALGTLKHPQRFDDYQIRDAEEMLGQWLKTTKNKLKVAGLSYEE